MRLLDSPQDVRLFEQPACDDGDDEAGTSEGHPRGCSRSFWSANRGIRVLEYV